MKSLMSTTGFHESMFEEGRWSISVSSDLRSHKHDELRGSQTVTTLFWRAEEVHEAGTDGSQLPSGVTSGGRDSPTFRSFGVYGAFRRERGGRW